MASDVNDQLSIYVFLQLTMTTKENSNIQETLKRGFSMFCVLSFSKCKFYKSLAGRVPENHRCISRI